jgi:uncharacterized protein (TIGR02145 family)
MLSEYLTQNINIVVTDSPNPPSTGQGGLFGFFGGVGFIPVAIAIAVVVAVVVTYLIRVRQYGHKRRLVLNPTGRSMRMLAISLAIVSAATLAIALSLNAKSVLADNQLAITATSNELSIRLTRTGDALTDQSGTLSASAASDVTVQTDIPSGYTLYVKQANLSSGGIALSLQDSANVGGEPTAIGNTNQALKTTTGATSPAGDTIGYILTATVPNDLPAGNYTGQVVYTATAQPTASPVVTSVSPGSGHFIGGETITITGNNFTGATAVSLGTSTCRSYTVVSDTKITCVSSGSSDNGASAAFVVSVNVTTSEGTNAANTLFSYRYPNLSYTSGGAYVHILGTDIALGSNVTVGAVNCNSLVVLGGTSVVCNSPKLSSAGSKALAITAPATSQDTMQNWAGCTSMPTPAYTTTDWPPYTILLTDTRNNQDYRVRKMPDGKCWMIDNLKLADYTLTSADSNVASNFTVPANPAQGASTHSNGVCTSSVTVTNDGGFLTCDGSSATTVDSSSPGDNLQFIAYSDPSATVNPYYKNCRPGSSGVDYSSPTGCGYLYNWYTATAGSGLYSLSPSNSQATASICPVGWRLPSSTSDTGGPTTSGTSVTVADFPLLNAAMATGSVVGDTTNSVTTRPNWRANGPFAGSYSGLMYASSNGFTAQGYTGHYWSSTDYSSTPTRARSILVGPNSLSPSSNSYSKYTGMAVRCVVD